jgi:hypothetical protein
MLRTAIQWGTVTAALAAPLLVLGCLVLGCLDDHTAEECQYIGTCLLPDAGADAADADNE